MRSCADRNGYSSRRSTSRWTTRVLWRGSSCRRKAGRSDIPSRTGSSKISARSCLITTSEHPDTIAGRPFCGNSQAYRQSGGDDRGTDPIDGVEMVE